MASEARPIKILALTPRARPWPGGSLGSSPGLRPVCHRPRPGSRAIQPFSRLSEVFREAFAQGENLVCIMAAGIVVRGIAPYLQGKDTDPAVVVVDEAGRFAVSLLSGHLGGANELARRVAKLLGGTPVITTATDVQGLPALDRWQLNTAWSSKTWPACGRSTWPCWKASRPAGGPRGFYLAELSSLSGIIHARPRPGPGPGRPPPHGLRGLSGTRLAPGVAQAPPPEPGGRHGLP